MEDEEKIYRCEALIGLVTDTQDIWGEIKTDNRTNAAKITAEDVRQALMNFCGTILQTPPKFSALKLNGKRLYQYAREGIGVEIQPREVSVYDVQFIHYDAQKQRAMFDIRCSKGTYVRTICHDLGALLGVGACMSFLLRTRTSGFDICQSYTFEQLLSAGRNEIESMLHPPADAVKTMPRLELDADAALLFLNGNPSFAQKIAHPELTATAAGDRYAVFGTGRLLGVASAEAGRGYRILKVLH